MVVAIQPSELRSAAAISRRREKLHMIEHIFAILGAGSAMTTVAFLVLYWRAVEAPSND